MNTISLAKTGIGVKPVLITIEDARRVGRRILSGSVAIRTELPPSKREDFADAMAAAADEISATFEVAASAFDAQALAQDILQSVLEQIARPCDFLHAIETGTLTVDVAALRNIRVALMREQQTHGRVA